MLIKRGSSLGELWYLTRFKKRIKRMLNIAVPLTSKCTLREHLKYSGECALD